MPVDTGIYANLLRAPKSIADYDAEAQAAQGNALASQLRRQQIEGNALSMRQAQQKQAEADADTNALRTLAGGWNSQTTADQRIAGLRNSGRVALMGQADALEKQYVERTKAKSEIAGRDVETENKVVTMWRDMVGNAANPEQAAQMVAAMHADPRIANTPMARVPLDQAMQMLQQTPFDQWKQQFALGAAKFVEMNKPTTTSVDRGTTKVMLQTPGMGGAPVEVRTDSVAVDPNTAATNARMAADARASREQSASQFNQRLNYDKEKDKAKAAGGPAKPLPAAALKMQQESLDAIGISSSINADLGGIGKQIADGKLSFGPVSNLANSARNAAGMSSENSRNFASFKSTLERLRNESLRLNSGVQTDGDAQRAWNELFQNINDTDLVNQRLTEIQNINKRGAQLHQMRVDSIRANYNAGPLDAAPYRDQPAAVGGSTPNPTPNPTPGRVTPSAGAVQTATNPKTGEKLQLVNGQWVPAK